MPEFRVAVAGGHPANQLHAGPYAAGILPAAAGTAEPFAEQRPRQHQPAFVLLQPPVQRPGLAGGAHADGNERGQQVRGNGQPRTLGDVVDVADDFQAAARPDHTGEQVRQLLAGAFNARRHDARRDDRRLEQAQIIAGEIEHLGELADVRAGAQVDAGQAQNRFVNDAQIGFHRRARRGVPAMHAQIDGNIQHPRAFGKIHAQEKNVAPAAVAEVHAHRRALAQNRVAAIGIAPQQFRAQTQRMVRRMPHAKHPLIAADGAHAAPHLVGERLKREPLIGRRQRAGDGVAGAFGLLRGEKFFNRLGKPAVQQVLETRERNQAALTDARFERQMEPVNGVKKKQRPDALVKIVAAPPKGVEFGAGRHQFFPGRRAADGIE